VALRAAIYRGPPERVILPDLMRELELNLRMESAIRQESPAAALAELARLLKSQGMTQLEMYRLFDDFRDRHELNTGVLVQEAILETMDIISGWCPPGSQLFGPASRA
jgi:hypothetical protein